MTYQEREALTKYYTNLDKELYESNTHIITSYINLIDSDKEIPILSAIYNPEADGDDVVLGRTVTNRVTTKIHHLSVFEEFEKSYLIAYPIGETVDWNWNCSDFFEGLVAKLKVDSTVYFTNSINDEVSHRVCSGYTTYDVKLFPICTIIAEDASLFPSGGTPQCYAICAIKEIIDKHIGVNGSYGIKDIKEFFDDIDKILNRVDGSKGVPYPNDITLPSIMVQIMLKDRIVKANKVIKLKNLPTIGDDLIDNELTINVKYLDPDMPKIEILDKGDWIDLCTVEYTQLKPGDFKLIPLGVIIQIPEGYEALLLPRASTFKKWGILVANSMGVINNSYNSYRCPDQWMVAAFATKEIEIPKYTRIAQFRLIKNQPKININEIDEITEDSRGGFGSTGN